MGWDTLKTEILRIIKYLVSIYSYIFWVITRDRTKLYKENNSKNVLLILTGAVGDSICFIPLINILSKKYNIFVISKKPFYDILRLDRNIKKIYDIEKEDLINLAKSKEFRGVIIGSTKSKEDLVKFSKIFDNSISHIGHYVYPIQFKKMSEIIFPVLNKTHPAKIHFKFLKFFGIKITKPVIPDNFGLYLKIPSSIKTATTKKFKIPKKYVILSASSISQKKKGTKLPSISKMAKILDYIIENYNYNIILDGLKEDIELYDKLIKKSRYPKKVMITAGKTSLIDLLVIISNAQLLIAVDSGSVHLAATQNTKTISIIREELKDIWYPWMKSDNYRLIACKKGNFDNFELKHFFNQIDSLLL